MDDINEFFSLTKEFKREVVPGYVSARPSRIVPKSEPNPFRKREFVGANFGEEHREAELEELKLIAELEPGPKRFKHESNDDDDDDDSEVDDSTSMGTDAIDTVYNRYEFNRKLPDLPIVEMKDLILKRIKQNPIVILEGATGCGKTTQVPQFILDDAYQKGKSVNIVVTQPRKIAAISIANRVAKERGLSDLPNLIGYQVGLNIKTNDDTRITFCTTGVLLEKLVAWKTLINYTHIILDEVHERSQNMDFLFIVIKQLRHTAPHVRIILMSATIEAAEFAEYFSSYRDSVLTPAPVIKVDKKSNFDIKQFYLDDLTKLNVKMSEPIDIANPEITEEMYLTAVKLIHVANRIDNTDGFRMDIRPTILIFLPGIYEIGCMNKHIAENTKILQDEPIVVILHSMISHDEQVRAMKAPPPGHRMIILATNVAESSITVPNVKYVIDFCLTKNNVTDSTTNFTSLKLEWCSRSNCRQRAGRAGRTMDGRVYRLVPKYFYENQMDESGKPEMCRCALENVVLKAKQLNMGSPCKIISLAMDRPTKYDIQNTILLLKETGALLRTVDGQYSDEDGDMTFIGHVMAALPVNIHVAKLIVLGYCFGVLSDCIIIGAGLTTKSIFEQGMKNVVRFYSKKLFWSDGSGSDLIAILKAYTAYVECKKNQVDIRKWADRYYLNEKSLSEMTLLVAEITERLERLNVKERVGMNRPSWSYAEKLIILKVVIAGAFYPNYFVHSSSEMDQREMFRTLNGRDPSNTLFFSGFPEKYIRPLYVQSIKKLLAPCTNSLDNIQVNFGEGTEKMFVSFKQTKSSVEANTDPDLGIVEMGPGQTCIELYKALKLKKSPKPFDLRVMHPVEANKYAEKMKIGSFVQGKMECKKNKIKNIEMLCLPRPHVKYVTGKITHYDTNFNRFWIRSVDEQRFFNEIQSELNSPNPDIEEFSNYDDVQVGQVIAASHNGNFYRAKVLSVVGGSDDVFYKVFLMDIGLESDLDFSELRRLRGVSARYIEIPPRILECRLAFLQPSALTSARYGWESIMSELKKLTSDSTICAEIYSVCNGVASVSIYVHDRTVQDILIDEGFARTADEDFMSKLDHDLRVNTQAKNNSRFDEECDVVEEEMRKMLPFEENCEVEEPNLSQRHITVTLKGPKSPLERSIFTCLHQAKSQSKRVAIEAHSVNSVLLDANPQDSFEKYVVSGNVTENTRTTEWTARETTMMPNIPGFGPIMALIFSPYCEFFCDRYKSRYVAIFCGLGENPKNKQPLYSEHDTIFNLDTEIDMTDIENINKIRVIMDSVLQMKPGQKQPKINEHTQNELTLSLKTAIMSLLERERALMGIPYISNIGWSKYHPHEVIKAKGVFLSTAIFPPHSIPSLAAEDSPDRLHQLNNLIENNKELHRNAKTDFITLRRAIKCFLCQLDLETLADLRIHLYSRLHREREKRISLDN